MGGEEHGTEEAQDEQQQQETQQQKWELAPEAAAVDGDPQAFNVSDYEAQIAERDAKITELEERIAEAAKNAETADELRGQIAELKAQGVDERVEFALQLAGCRNVKAAKAVLSDHGGDVEALKAAEPWMFADSPAKQTGKTGLPNAGTAADDGKTLKRWEKLAGLDDDE